MTEGLRNIEKKKLHQQQQQLIWNERIQEIYNGNTEISQILWTC